MSVRAATRRFAESHRDGKTLLYYAACVGLLIVAAGLRFPDLDERSIRSDEVMFARVSLGPLSEIIPRSRDQSAPVLYYLVLHAVQRVESSAFSIRAVSAVASVLTVVAMLFLLPRVGVARGAAFLAALLATLSVEAIWHARDSREYSADALLALLMVVGLLRYLRDGKKVLLGACLLVAPLLQYGLVLFGVAVIATATVAPRASATPAKERLPRRIGAWLKRRLDLAAPCGFFLGGSIVSYLVTLRHQWQEGGFGSGEGGGLRYLSRFYFQGEFDARSIFEFSIDGVWSLLTYHLPAVVATAGLASFAIVLAAASLRTSQGAPQARAILVLFSFCIAISVAAAVLGLYPLGGTRQATYLGPIVFLAVGVAFHWAADCLSAPAGRRWTMLALTGGTALVGVSDTRENSAYLMLEATQPVLAVLKERVRKEDMVYAGWPAALNIPFHLPEEERPANYHYGTTGWCRPSPNACLREMADWAQWSGLANGRIWFVVRHGTRKWKSNPFGVPAEEIIARGRPSLYLFADAEALMDRHASGMAQDVEAILTGKPLIRSTFDVHLNERTLIYFKEPCGAEDVRDTFFLQIDPVDPSDLPEGHRRRGHHDLYFHFNDRGGRWLRSAERCAALRELPSYDIAGIRTGQFNDAGRLWEGEARFDE